MATLKGSETTVNQLKFVYFNLLASLGNHTPNEHYKMKTNMVGYGEYSLLIEKYHLML